MSSGGIEKAPGPNIGKGGNKHSQDVLSMLSKLEYSRAKLSEAITSIQMIQRDTEEVLDAIFAKITRA